MKAKITCTEYMPENGIEFEIVKGPAIIDEDKLPPIKELELASGINQL